MANEIPVCLIWMHVYPSSRRHHAIDLPRVRSSRVKSIRAIRNCFQKSWFLVQTRIKLLDNFLLEPKHTQVSVPGIANPERVEKLIPSPLCLALKIFIFFSNRQVIWSSHTTRLYYNLNNYRNKTASRLRSRSTNHRPSRRRWNPLTTTSTWRNTTTNISIRLRVQVSYS